MRSPTRPKPCSLPSMAEEGRTKGRMSPPKGTEKKELLDIERVPATYADAVKLGDTPNRLRTVSASF